MTVQNPAPGYPRIIPYLQFEGGRGEAAIAYYVRHLGATERMRLPMKNAEGAPRIGHCELMFGDSMVMLSDFSGLPQDANSKTVQIMLYVDGIDAMFADLMANGCQEIMPLQDLFYGDRAGAVRDPFGHAWHLAQHMRDVSPEEMQATMDKMNADA